MRVSYNELQGVCAKAFSAIGFPPGVDTDAAFMVAWLQLHQFPGAETLAAQLPELLGRESVSPAVESQTIDYIVLNADAQSTLVAASDAVDLAWSLANGSDSGCGQVRVNSCLGPLFAIPIAARRGGSGAWLHLGWSANNDDINIHIDNEGGVSVYGDVTTLAEIRPQVTGFSITCFREDPHTLIGKLNYESGNPSLNPTDLDERKRESLSKGLPIDKATWSKLSELSKRSLVPASDASRERGAGAQISDND